MILKSMYTIYCHKNTCLKLHAHDLLYKELKASAAVNIYEGLILPGVERLFK